ncbi:ester cyclase [Streptomyces wedmorensis]
MSNNKEKILSLWRAFNERDWQAMISDMADDFGFYDNTLGVGGIGKQAFVEYEKAFVAKMSDLNIFEIDCVDSGNVVMCIASSQGTSDGEDFLPGLPANGKRSGIRFCTVWRFDTEGRITGCEGFYDLLTYLVELGHTTIAPAQKVLKPEIPPHIAAHYV